MEIDLTKFSSAEREDIQAHIRGRTDQKDTYDAPKHGWTCFHCGETFRTSFGAKVHFGADPSAKPGCMMKVNKGTEHAFLAELREAEDQLIHVRKKVLDYMVENAHLKTRINQQ
jgi:hypothetical protein